MLLLTKIRWRFATSKPLFSTEFNFERKICKFRWHQTSWNHANVLRIIILRNMWPLILLLPVFSLQFKRVTPMGCSQSRVKSLTGPRYPLRLLLLVDIVLCNNFPSLSDCGGSKRFYINVLDIPNKVFVDIHRSTFIVC